MASPPPDPPVCVSDKTFHIYEDYTVNPDPSHRPMYLATALEFLRELPSGAAVLDAGCGGGDFSIGLAEAGFTCFGSDLNASGINHAETLGVGNFRVASLYDHLAEPFGRKYFDAIVAVEVIEHLYSPKTFVERAYEALPPGGLLVVTSPYWGWLKNIALAVTNRMDRALTALWEGGHIKHFSRATLTELMQRAGFVEVAFHGAGEGWRAHAPYLWVGMIMAFRKPT